MSTSETVQAAQRLQISGTLVKMGGEIPSLMIECDGGDIVAVANLPAALLSEMPMLLYKRVRLTVEAEVEPVPAAAPECAEPRFGPITSDFADAERNIQAKEDAERAAYIARWKDAPEWANWATQTGAGFAFFVEDKPEPNEIQGWYTYTGRIVAAPKNVLGSVRCEPRPTQATQP